MKGAEDALAAQVRALAAVGGGDKFLGLKIAWDETALRMHLPIEELRRAFPDLTFHEPPPDDPPPADVQSPAAARQPRTKPSHTLQVMQRHVNISVDGGTSSGKIPTTPKILGSTTAKELLSGLSPEIARIPELASGFKPDDDWWMFVNLHGDSVAANKLLCSHIIDQFPFVLMSELPCFGRTIG